MASDFKIYRYLARWIHLSLLRIDYTLGAKWVHGDRCPPPPPSFLRERKNIIVCYCCYCYKDESKLDESFPGSGAPQRSSAEQKAFDKRGPRELLASGITLISFGVNHTSRGTAGGFIPRRKSFRTIPYSLVRKYQDNSWTSPGPPSTN